MSSAGHNNNSKTMLLTGTQVKCVTDIGLLLTPSGITVLLLQGIHHVSHVNIIFLQMIKIKVSNI